MSQTLNDTDLEIITRQIGRAPRGLTGIGRKCSYGCPEVIITLPFIDDIFFPTTSWLTCPLRVKKVNKLEGDGWIVKLERHLAADSHCRDELARATSEYIIARANLAESPVSSDFEDQMKTGINGATDILSITCLHAHLADFLVGGVNPIGKRVANLIGEISCSKDCLL